MQNHHALRLMVQQAISTEPARFARLHPIAMPADTHRAEGAQRAYLHCLTLVLGDLRPTGDAPADTASLGDALGEVIRHAADTLDEPDYDAVVRAVRAIAALHVPPPPLGTARPLSMQERILAALTDVGQRVAHQVTIQPVYANTGRMYITLADTFTTLVEVLYDFQGEYCGLQFRGPGIDALGLQDSPPRYRYRRSASGDQLDYHHLRYTDGERITAMLDLLARALAFTPGAAQTETATSAAHADTIAARLAR
ncbi:hypothetical protein [Micromonospora aurantiaca (nom. illeg.)]|uniref:hypothetical protein n=1 Tax=Micromonospora aurantiaca (nom. illeg.) TaxID=47850 RepID=UPI0033CA829F